MGFGGSRSLITKTIASVRASDESQEGAPIRNFQGPDGVAAERLGRGVGGVDDEGDAEANRLGWVLDCGWRRLVATVK